MYTKHLVTVSLGWQDSSSYCFKATIPTCYLMLLYFEYFPFVYHFQFGRYIQSSGIGISISDNGFIFFKISNYLHFFIEWLNQIL